jgi:hypothetical protein
MKHTSEIDLTDLQKIARSLGCLVKGMTNRDDPATIADVRHIWHRAEEAAAREAVHTKEPIDGK